MFVECSQTRAVMPVAANRRPSVMPSRACYLVGTPQHRLKEFQQELLNGQWREVADRPGVRVQLVEMDGEVFVLARSVDRA